MPSLRRGALLMVAASVCFATMAACVRACQGRIPFFEVAFFRSLIALPPVWVAIRIRRVPIRTARPGLLLWRSIVGFASMALYFYGLTHLQLGDAVMMAGTAPIFVALLAPIFLGEKKRWQVGVAIAVALVGLGLLLHPKLAVANMAGLAAVASGFAASFAYLAIRELSRTDDPDVIVFGFTALATLLAAGAMLFDFETPRGIEWAYLIGSGLAAGAGQSLMTRAYARQEAAVVGALSYATPLFSWLIGVSVFHEAMDRQSVIGGAVVIAAGSYLAFARREGSPPARF